MIKPASTLQIEPRWPVALTVMFVLGVLRVLPDRIRVLPIWFQSLFGIALLAAMLAVGVMKAKQRWLRVERLVLLIFCIVNGVLMLWYLVHLIREMLYHSTDLDGLQLLTSSIGVWVTNVLIFSLLYWRFDRGGPENRVHHTTTRPDLLFPQTGLSEAEWADWEPTFVDYLFLSFTAATAFSPTDTLPLTTRAKLAMMLEGAISLMTLVVVGARAINILGS
ncbi:MAG TPA: hypothetical protein IGS53_22160 [Leptolyngbyaceae cyanobacterium M33_DOE_097]|uniref:DUF1345 domain-containing protein n=1 Tax=Oscillatoriales cyanobacterium SpSt-418 TaxID=2282169 RepID=A0A7C3KGE3_9CYAN|nr:hypothetical protein [Leptolyngbyaceae cyanobacterium M33_DOE_097]